MAEPPLDSVLAQGMAQMPEISREEILRQIFGDIGELIDDFTCAVESTVLLHGRLYVTSKFICFYSNLFGLEKKIRIPYSHIKSITKENTALVIPNAIAISTEKKDYIFRSFWDRDECHRMLVLFLQRFNGIEGNMNNFNRFNGSIRTEPLLATTTTTTIPGQGGSSSIGDGGGSSNSTVTSSPGQGTVDSSNGGTNNNSINNNNNNPGETSPVLTVDSSYDPVIRDRRSSTRVGGGVVGFAEGEGGMSAKANRRGTMKMFGGGSGGGSLTPTHGSSSSNAQHTATIASATATAVPPMAQAVPSVEEDVLDTESGTGFKSNANDGGDALSHFNTELTKDHLKLPIVTHVHLVEGFTLDEYINLFIAENAPYSYRYYHELVKDNNLIVSPWSELSSSLLGQSREIKFFKPVNLPGLASTRGVKLQRFMKFGDYGLILCSSTRLEDVPAADTFSVDDVLAIHVDEENSKRLSVEISFQVSFLKSTYMKFIIERSTNAEMTKWLENFFGWVKRITEEYKAGKINLDDARRANGVASNCPTIGLKVDTTTAAAAATATTASTTTATTTTAANKTTTAATATVSTPAAIHIPTAAASALPSTTASTTTTATTAARITPDYSKLPWYARLLQEFLDLTLIEKMKVIMTLAMILFLIFNYLRWKHVHKKMGKFEEKLSTLEQALAQFVKLQLEENNRQQEQSMAARIANAAAAALAGEQ